MNLIERIVLFMENEAISCRQLEKRLSVEKNSIQTIIDHKDADFNVSSQVLEKICNAYAHLNPIWLLTGKGEMFVTSYYQVGKALENTEAQEGIYHVMAAKDTEIQLLKEHIEGLTSLIDAKNKLIDEYKK